MEYKFEKNKMDLQVLRDFCEHEGEFVADYPTFLYGHPSQTTIEAMMPSRVLRVAGQQLEQYFGQSMETMKLRAVIAEGFFVLFSCIVQILHSQIVCEGASEPPRWALCRRAKYKKHFFPDFCPDGALIS
jgi:hypothetical protein